MNCQAVEFGLVLQVSPVAENSVRWSEGGGQDQLGLCDSLNQGVRREVGRDWIEQV